MGRHHPIPTPSLPLSISLTSGDCFVPITGEQRQRHEWLQANIISEITAFYLISIFMFGTDSAGHAANKNYSSIQRRITEARLIERPTAQFDIWTIAPSPVRRSVASVLLTLSRELYLPLRRGPHTGVLQRLQVIFC